MLLNMLGQVQYGLFASITIITSVNSFTNLGLSQALTNTIASENDQGKANDAILVTFLFIAIIAITLTFLGPILLPRILGLMGLNTNENIDEAINLCYWIFASTLVLMFGQVFKAIIDGLGLIYISNYAELFYRVLYWLTIVIAAKWKGISLIGPAIFFSTVVWFMVLLGITRHHYKNFTSHSNIIQLRNAFIKQIEFGWKIYVSGLISFGFEPLARLIILRRYGLVISGHMDIAIRVKNQVWGLVRKMLLPLFPYFSEKSKRDALIATVNIQNWLHPLLLILSILLSILMGPFIRMWLGGNSSSELVYLIVFITIVYVLLSATVVSYYLFLMSLGSYHLILIQLLNASVCLGSLLLLDNFDVFVNISISFVLALGSSYCYIILVASKLAKNLKIEEGLSKLPIHLLTLLVLLTFFIQDSSLYISVSLSILFLLYVLFANMRMFRKLITNFLINGRDI